MIKKITSYFIFISAVLFLFFFRTARIPLWSSDEGRYGEIAREMWELKDFIVPHFNYLEYLEKPFFSTFLTSLAFGLLGINALAARLVSIIASILGIWITYLFTKKLLNEQVAKYSALILTTMIGYVLVGRFAVLDMLMTFELSVSLLSMLAAFQLRRPGFYLLAYAFMGLAFLTKGLIGILLPGLIFLSFLIWTKKWDELKHMKLGWGVLIISVIIIPWFLLVSLREPEFFDIFIVQQHFHRFVSGGFGRKKPFWFFAPILVATAFPWSFFLPVSITNFFNQEDRQKNIGRFLICWIAVIFIFFSLPKSKLPYYLLPTSIPIAILIGKFMADWLTQERLSSQYKIFMQWTWGLLLGITSLLFIGINAYLLFYRLGEDVLLLKPLLHFGTCLFLGGFSTGYLLHRFHKKNLSILTLALTVYLVLLFTATGMQIISPYQSSVEYAKIVKSQMTENDLVTVLASPDEFSDFPFYLAQRIVIVGTDKGTLTHETLEKEHHYEIDKWFWSKTTFASRFNSKSERIFCLMEAEKVRELVAAGVKNYTVVKEGGGKLLIKNFEN